MRPLGRSIFDNGQEFKHSRIVAKNGVMV
jgi:hypothetical protein